MNRTNAGFIAVVVAITIAMFLPSLNDGAPEMDEGTLVAYPSLVSEGLVPGRDFETFYGPAQPYAMAAVSDVAGHSLTVERLSGLTQRIVIALAIFAVVAPMGRWWGLIGATAAGVMLLGLGLQGLAILGGIAFLLIAIASLARVVPDGGRRDRSWSPFLVAGLAGAVALSFRPDLFPAVLLSAAPLVLWQRAGSFWSRSSSTYLAALVAGLIPLAIWAVVVGPDDLNRVVSDLAASRDGRHLPLPGLSSADGQLLLATVLIAAGDLVVAALLLTRDRFSREGRLTLAISLLLIALLPSAFQRADSAHILPVAAVAVGLLPVAIKGLIELRVWHRLGARIALGTCALLVTVGVAHQAEGAIRAKVASVSQGGETVTVGDRSFRVGDPAAAEDLNDLLPVLSERAAAGSTIFVGPADLSRTDYTDTFVYYLFPRLDPASFYTEVNPGTTNADDSSLPDELESADFVLLTTRYDGMGDTEAARRAGSEAAEEVLDERFCEVARAGTYTLYGRMPCTR